MNCTASRGQNGNYIFIHWPVGIIKKPYRGRPRIAVKKMKRIHYTRLYFLRSIGVIIGIGASRSRLRLNSPLKQLPAFILCEREACNLFDRTTGPCEYLAAARSSSFSNISFQRLDSSTTFRIFSWLLYPSNHFQANDVIRSRKVSRRKINLEVPRNAGVFSLYQSIDYPSVFY